MNIVWRGSLISSTEEALNTKRLPNQPLFDTLKSLQPHHLGYRHSITYHMSFLLVSTDL